MYDNLLYRQIKDDLATNQFQLLAPREIRGTIFTHLHEQRYAGHLGRDRTIAAVNDFPGLE